MMKNFLLSVFAFLTVSVFAEPIEGIWLANKEKNGKQGCFVMVYENNDKFYGRIIATYDDLDQGLNETINDPKERAPGVEGNPFYCGLDMVWVDNSAGSTYEGHVVDPEAGKIYRASLRRDGNNLILRGKFGPFFSNRPWPKAPESVLTKIFPKGLPDSSKFVPKIPVVK
jgi:uncharacterized protein (DUF2147 family)